MSTAVLALEKYLAHLYRITLSEREPLPPLVLVSTLNATAL